MRTLYTLAPTLAALLLAPVGCGDDATDPRDTEPRDSGNAEPGDSSVPSEAGSGGAPADAQVADSGVDAAPAPALREVTIRFAAKVRDADFACGESYDDVGSKGTTITPRELRFYVQDLQLTTSDGHAVPVQIDERAPWQSETVALLDFASTAGSCMGFGTPETNAVITGRVPEDDYTGIVFANGVPEELNHGDLPTLPPPLQVGGMQWTWLLGYRFVKLEVAEVVTPPEVPGVGSLHTGSTGCSGAPRTGFTCARPNRNRVELDGFDPDADTVVFDVAEALADLDLETNSQCHGSDALCETAFPALGIDFATGNPLDSPSVYRVE